MQATIFKIQQNAIIKILSKFIMYNFLWLVILIIHIKLVFFVRFKIKENWRSILNLILSFLWFLYLSHPPLFQNDFYIIFDLQFKIAGPMVFIFPFYVSINRKEHPLLKLINLLLFMFVFYYYYSLVVGGLMNLNNGDYGSFIASIILSLLATVIFNVQFKCLFIVESFDYLNSIQHKLLRIGVDIESNKTSVFTNENTSKYYIRKELNSSEDIKVVFFRSGARFLFYTTVNFLVFFIYLLYLFSQSVDFWRKMFYSGVQYKI